jgi:hypothetical protein
MPVDRIRPNWQRIIHPLTGASNADSHKHGRDATPRGNQREIRSREREDSTFPKAGEWRRPFDHQSTVGLSLSSDYGMDLRDTSFICINLSTAPRAKWAVALHESSPRYYGRSPTMSLRLPCGTAEKNPSGFWRIVGSANAILLMSGNFPSGISEYHPPCPHTK